MVAYGVGGGHMVDGLVEDSLVGGENDDCDLLSRSDCYLYTRYFHIYLSCGNHW